MKRQPRIGRPDLRVQKCWDMPRTSWLKREKQCKGKRPRKQGAGFTSEERLQAAPQTCRPCGRMGVSEAARGADRPAANGSGDQTPREPFVDNELGSAH